MSHNIKSRTKTVPTAQMRLRMLELTDYVFKVTQTKDGVSASPGFVGLLRLLCLPESSQQ